MMILFNVDLKQLAINNFYLYTICFLMPLIAFFFRSRFSNMHMLYLPNLPGI